MPKSKSKSKRLAVVREMDKRPNMESYYCVIEHAGGNPTLEEHLGYDDWWRPIGVIQDFCHEEWERLTGITLSPGEWTFISVEEVQ